MQAQLFVLFRGNLRGRGRGRGRALSPCQRFSDDRKLQGKVAGKGEQQVTQITSRFALPIRLVPVPHTTPLVTARSGPRCKPVGPCILWVQAWVYKDQGRIERIRSWQPDFERNRNGAIVVLNGNDVDHSGEAKHQTCEFGALGCGGEGVGMVVGRVVGCRDGCGQSCRV